MSKALLKAAALGQNAKLEGLLASGVYINFKDKATGRTALIESAIAGHADTARLLIKNAASLDCTDDVLGYTALGWAAHQGHMHIVKTLLAARASVDLTECEIQQTPVMIAAREGHHDIVVALLAAGANVHLESGNARNALSIAQECGRTDIVGTLKKQGALAPASPAEISISWPIVTADLSDVDDADPASVLRGFMLAMHRWETDCYSQQQSAGDEELLDWSVIQQAQNQIFERFCTPKPRTYGRLGSFGFPPTYTPDDTLVSIEHQARRILLMTLQAPSTRMRYEVLFSLVRKEGVWRIDTKKRRPWGSSANWEVAIL